ncbi:MAG: hypothetical protein FWG57_08970 [Endomicrobia bacterium]|nr:hypothetical protein [Endomicrobiia bacterium]
MRINSSFAKLKIFLICIIFTASFCIAALHTHNYCSETKHCDICLIMHNVSVGHSAVCISFILFVIYISLSVGQKYGITVTSSKLSRAPPSVK